MSEESEDSVVAEIKIDIGAGGREEPGWISWDIKQQRHASDMSELADATVSEIRACHVLEHVPMAATLPTLVEWFRVLKPGGRLYVAVPDFPMIADLMLGGSQDSNLERYIMGGQTDEDDFHYAIFSSHKLGCMMLSAGFERTRKMPPEGPNTSQHWCSLNMECFKP